MDGEIDRRFQALEGRMSKVEDKLDKISEQLAAIREGVAGIKSSLDDKPGTWRVVLIVIAIGTLVVASRPTFEAIMRSSISTVMPARPAP